MSHEQPTEETKMQEEEASPVNSIIETFLRAKGLPSGVNLRRRMEALRYACAAEPLREFGERADKPPIVQTIFFIDGQGGYDNNLAVFVTSERQASADEEVDQPFDEYLAQIDQSRQQALAKQGEIDQLRIETRQLIAQLFVA
jgi:hypothetical protein